MMIRMVLSEDAIERRAEAAMDSLDRRLMAGQLSQADYDREVSILDRWASDAIRAAIDAGYH